MRCSWQKPALMMPWSLRHQATDRRWVPQPHRTLLMPRLPRQCRTSTASQRELWSRERLPPLARARRAARRGR